MDGVLVDVVSTIDDDNHDVGAVQREDGFWVIGDGA